MAPRARLFFGSFAITVIIILGLCGFLMVDLSTDKYMPGQFKSIYTIDSVSAEGLAFTIMGMEYNLSAGPLGAYAEEIYRFRGLIPAGQYLVWQGVLYAKDGLDNLASQREVITDAE